MCPNWKMVVREVNELACDRVLAASSEPDERERDLLLSEALVLARAAQFAASRPSDPRLIDRACRGLVVQCEEFALWGMTEQAERDLRALVERQGMGARTSDPCLLLALILGASLEDAVACDCERLAA